VREWVAWGPDWAGSIACGLNSKYCVWAKAAKLGNGSARRVLDVLCAPSPLGRRVCKLDVPFPEVLYGKVHFGLRCFSCEILLK